MAVEVEDKEYTEALKKFLTREITTYPYIPSNVYTKVIDMFDVDSILDLHATRQWNGKAESIERKSYLSHYTKKETHLNITYSRKITGGISKEAFPKEDIDDLIRSSGAGDVIIGKLVVRGTSEQLSEQFNLHKNTVFALVFKSKSTNDHTFKHNDGQDFVRDIKHQHENEKILQTHPGILELRQVWVLDDWIKGRNGPLPVICTAKYVTTTDEAEYKGLDGFWDFTDGMIDKTGFKQAEKRDGQETTPSPIDPLGYRPECSKPELTRCTIKSPIKCLNGNE